MGEGFSHSSPNGDLHSSDELVAIQAVIHGLVQGVGFRYHTQRKAKVLQLTGWVKNRGDGTVEVRAEGARDAISRFEHYLHTGPSQAHISQVEIRRPPHTDQFAAFTVEY